ncbi:MAG: glycosyltransferase family 2 protein [Caldicoprobacterales bacterium]|jgi:glycosyltransferase involved in cell wall biosynthesis
MGMLPQDIGVIIPAYNEAANLAITLRALKKVPIIKDILVVDDGSWDETGDIAVKEGVNLLSLDKNQGKGNALQMGVKHLNNRIIVFLDADIGDTATEATKLIYPILRDEAEVTIGKIDFTPGKGGFGFVKGLSRVGFKSLTGKECCSVLSGQRAFKREVLAHELLSYRGYGIEFGMTVDLALKDVRIMEIPIDICHRVTGRDLKGFKHRSIQFLDILKVILQKKIKMHYIKRVD